MSHACCTHSYPCVSEWACYCLCVLDCIVHSGAEGNPLYFLLTPWHWRMISFLEICGYLCVTFSHTYILYILLFYPFTSYHAQASFFLCHSHFLSYSLSPPFLSPLRFSTSSLSYSIFNFLCFHHVIFSLLALCLPLLTFYSHIPHPSHTLSLSLSLCLYLSLLAGGWVDSAESCCDWSREGEWSQWHFIVRGMRWGDT